MDFNQRMLDVASGYMKDLQGRIDKLTEKNLEDMAISEILDLILYATEFIRYASIVRYIVEDPADNYGYDVKALDDSILEYAQVLGAAQHYRFALLEQKLGVLSIGSWVKKSY